MPIPPAWLAMASAMPGTLSSTPRGAWGPPMSDRTPSGGNDDEPLTIARVLRRVRTHHHGERGLARPVDLPPSAFAAGDATQTRRHHPDHAVRGHRQSLHLAHGAEGVGHHDPIELLGRDPRTVAFRLVVTGPS